MLSDTSLSSPQSNDVISSGSYTIQSSATSSYSYSKTTRTPTSTSGAPLEEPPLSQQANANSFITRVLGNKLSSSKFSSDQLNAAPNKMSMIKTDPKSKIKPKSTSASPPQDPTATSETHVASLSIQLAPRSPEPQAETSQGLRLNPGQTQWTPLTPREPLSYHQDQQAVWWYYCHLFTVIMYTHTTGQKFGIMTIFLCFWKKSLMLTKAAFIWLKIQ